MKKFILILISVVIALAPVLFIESKAIMDVNTNNTLFSPIKKTLPIKPINEDLNLGIIATSTIISDEDVREDSNENTNPDGENQDDGLREDYIYPIDSGDAPLQIIKDPEIITSEDTKVEESKPDEEEKINENSSVQLKQIETSQNSDKLFIENEKAQVEEILATDNINKAIIDFAKIDVGANLDVCNLDNGCSGDMGKTHWVKEASVFYNDYKRELRFYTKDNTYKQGILQVSNFSFEDIPDTAIIHSQGILTGVTLFDFSIFSHSNQSVQEMGENLVLKLSPIKDVKLPEKNQGVFSKLKKTFNNFFTAIKNIVLKPVKLVKSVFIKEKLEVVNNSSIGIENISFNNYYLRVIPTENGKVIGKASNQVKVSLRQPEEATQITIYKPAKLYEVKIKSFDPIRAPEPDVCNGAMILENDWTTASINGPITYKAGERVCPKPYKGVGEEAWYESLWNFAKSGVDWVSEAYQRLKKAVVDGLADVACGGNDYCRQAISAGLDIGLAAMGMPPTLPNFDELVDGGFDYLAGEIATQAGCFDPDCKKKIKEGLEMVLEGNKNDNPYCKNEEEAHRMGYEPLCLPDNVKAHIDPLGTYRQAKIVLEIKRTNLDGSSIMGAPYRLHFNNFAQNDLPVGSWIHNIQPYGASVQIKEPLKGTMFETKTIVLPEMEKGETMNIPIILTPKEYWVPGHKEAMQGWTTVTYKDGWPQYQYDDWWKLYYGGNLSLGAVIDACDYGMGDNDCIISSDYMGVVLPNGLNP